MNVANQVPLLENDWDGAVAWPWRRGAARMWPPCSDLNAYDTEDCRPTTMFPRRDFLSFNCQPARRLELASDMRELT